ncbi:ras association domain-containing protein 2 isoform X1 [Diceros bicornis minor]|uniref:ras association domain-containing protein 2 isoform X1 n=1 Tax=Diceros bicornis minor TaxID=77932 RepID=UPI0026EC71BB|nr:ras association domain-containing protein 2 isoform X1 [Diceros bicornis minor]XP_058419133.1 ras association domain-containing protein 2 isoform X1 [Diceros bicornis minor]
MDYSHQTSLVPCGQDKYISKKELLLHLKTYNLYYEGQNLQLRHREEEDEFIVEGLLNISWGLRRPIRLQMQDDNERIRPPPSSSSWHSGCNLGAQGTILKPLTMSNIQISEVDAPPERDQATSPTDSRGLKPVQEDTPQLMRTRSDVGVRRRGNVRTPSDQRRIRRHRFSINGHFYNHKTSVFTPAYGSVTNVRINSTMTTPQVLKLLLNKFKIENSAEEFALYVVHTSGEKQKLKNTDYPLIARILQGPCEQVSKVFLMEKDQVEEVTYDRPSLKGQWLPRICFSWRMDGVQETSPNHVAQYIKFEMPVLKSFIQKLQEEEDREVKKLIRKYTVLRLMIRQRLEEIAETPATI